MVQVTFVHICDYATISKEGKLSAIGIFDRINISAVPYVHPLMHVAFELSLHPAELGLPFQLMVRLAEPDGGVMVELSANGQVNGKAAAGTIVRVPQIFAFAGVPFPRVGSYSLDIFVNGDHKQTSAIQVSTAPPGQPQLPLPGLPQ
jgi:hypothetical protein